MHVLDAILCVPKSHAEAGNPETLPTTGRTLLLQPWKWHVIQLSVSVIQAWIELWPTLEWTFGLCKLQGVAEFNLRPSRVLFQFYTFLTTGRHFLIGRKSGFPANYMRE
jgi:hypothetical protein